jgi:calcineurin-like phosphoesterase family protein
MRTRSRLTFLALVVAIVASLYLTAGPPPPSPTPSGAFSFAVLGDAPYYVWEEIKYRLVMQDLRAHDLRLVLHVGDIFWRPCTDARYQRSLDWFNALPHPVIYTPGDNEWADCWTPAAGEFAPLERLARLRQLFYPAPTSLGGRRVSIVTQAGGGGYPEFVENVRWTHEGLVFVTVHLVGSGNAMQSFSGRTRQDDEAVVRRTAAATAWLREAFAEATASGAPAVVIGFHANPSFERSVDDPERRSYEPFLSALEEETERFGKPVLVVQGDDHIYTVDQPLIRRTTGRTLESLTRLQVPGSPDVGWVRVVVTPGARPSFNFEPRVVPRWKYW